MPELAEVEISRLKLLPAVQNRRILDFWTDWPRGFKSPLPVAKARRDIRGRKILGLSRRGKVLFFELAGKPARKIALHFRMSGRLLASSSKSKIASDKWTHFRWRLTGGREIRFIDPRKFGVVWYGSENDLKRDKYLANLGRDALRIPKKVFTAALRKKTGMVKAVLLHQDVIAGVGNIMADETLWRAKIHPKTKIADLSASALNNLHSALTTTVNAMLAAGGTSLRDWGHPDGKLGGYQEKRKIYGKAGEPCPRCKTKLARLIAGGRGTTVCPKCQRFFRIQNFRLRRNFGE